MGNSVVTGLSSLGTCDLIFVNQSVRIICGCKEESKSFLASLCIADLHRALCNGPVADCTEVP